MTKKLGYLLGVILASTISVVLTDKMTSDAVDKAVDERLVALEKKEESEE